MQDFESGFERPPEGEQAPSLQECAARLGLNPNDIRTLPFSEGDATAGSESELQAAVLGRAESVDLPVSIRESNYYANVIRQAAWGDASPKAISALEDYLRSNSEGVWENSWVRLPKRLLGRKAKLVLQEDLKADKGDPGSKNRSDADQFLFDQGGESMLRIPVSYLVKLSLAEFADSDSPQLRPIRETANRLMAHFLNDNTSPETYSFHVVRMIPRLGHGRQLARENARRYLLTALLAQSANHRYQLDRSGQEATIFFSPHTPLRQKRLNACISDSFYRELFMSPCLSGWNRGEAKRRYMALCHEVLSRSHLNAPVKLRDAGIIYTNLAVLPDTSNTSLANNGIHISLGSRRLTALRSDPQSGFQAKHEKYLGDLAIKVVEHFLSLFVGTCSAAPFRLHFADFHPERLLGFLAHELDFFHLRRLWKGWRRKARIRLFGRTLTPFGPLWLDLPISRTFRLKGDFVPDFRLIDYLAALLSTETSPALDGRLGNGERLASDLENLGVFDRRMSLYLPYKLREFSAIGFCGFEGRHHSLFPSLEQDMALATDLQALLNALAYKYIAQGEIDHSSIPDSPFDESERRQFLFGSAVGVQEFYVRRRNPNRLMSRILREASRVKTSRRDPRFLIVQGWDYRNALIRVLRQDAPDLIEMLGIEESIEDLTTRLADSQHSASGRLTQGILEEVGTRSPLKMRAEDFNRASESYYRRTLSRAHLEEALRLLERDLEPIQRGGPQVSREAGAALQELFQGGDACRFVAQARSQLSRGLDDHQVEQLVSLTLLAEYEDARRQEVSLEEGGDAALSRAAML